MCLHILYKDRHIIKSTVCPVLIHCFQIGKGGQVIFSEHSPPPIMAIHAFHNTWMKVENLHKTVNLNLSTTETIKPSKVWENEVLENF